MHGIDPAEIAHRLDTLWILMAAALVFMMQAGFLCLETGMTRSKNSINVALKNLADLGVSVIVFWLVGFGLMFGASWSGWLGSSQFLPEVGQGDPWNGAFFVFQLMFCGTAVTIVSGAVAERVKFAGYLAIAALVAVIYPVYGHWVWGGALTGQNGWLAEIGFVDFAGSTVVHSVGGWAALMACLIIGPRIDRFGPNGRPRYTPGSNMPIAILGGLLIWFGWIGFNGGSTLALDNSVPGIIADTMLAAVGGLIVTAMLGWVLHGYLQPSYIINGALAGLVAITAGCHAVPGWAAIVIGMGGGLVCYLVYEWLLRLKIDDVISAVPVHLAAGIWGTLAVALFGDPAALGTGLGMWSQLGVQAIGIAAAGVWTVCTAGPLLYVMNRVFGLRVTEEAERQGLNFAEHRASTELSGLATTIQEQVQTQDLSVRAPVEPFTEVGQIATVYNKLMEILEKTTTDVSELRKTEEMLREAIKEAESANEAKSLFLANMSHEIRTPLHGILSFADFGKKKVGSASPEKLEGYFDKIDVSGKRLLALVNNLLDLAKHESGQQRFEFEDCDLRQIVDGVVDEFGSLLASRGVEIEVDTPDTAVQAHLDSIKIMQVVRNLIGNAVKFSPAGEPISVRVEAEPELLRVSVRDRGVGVPEGELETIFEKFIQSSKTSSGAGGTGLGLSICREIAAGHGGRVWAENHREGGAMFVLELPRTPPDATGGVKSRVEVSA
ncbi:MAG: ammonium transporter [Planctomycetota bacterium]